VTAGVLLAISAELFRDGALNATTQTLCWAVIFFFASAGASPGYLTVSEVFPLEVRAKAIAVFFAIAQLFGAFGSHWYGHLIGTGTDRNSLFVGYLVGAGAMIIGGIGPIFFRVDADGQALGDVAEPLAGTGKPATAIFRSGSDREGIDDIAGTRSSTADTTRNGYGADSIPGQRYAEHDDPARTRPDDDPLA